MRSTRSGRGTRSGSAWGSSSASACSPAYVALFRGVVGEKVIHLEWSESYQITMAGLAATRLFSAGGAGGILLTYWALRKAGMEQPPVGLPDGRLPRRALLRLSRSRWWFSGSCSGPTCSPARRRCRARSIPAALAGGGDRHRPADGPGSGRRRAQDRAARVRRFGKVARRLATVPATFAEGMRTAIAFVRQPRSGVMAFGGAIGFWAREHRDPLGELPRLRRLRPARRRDPGLLPWDARQPDPVRPRRGGGGRRGDDRRLRPLRPPQRRGVRGSAHLSRDRLLAADPARESSPSSSCARPSTAGSGRGGSGPSGSGCASLRRRRRVVTIRGRRYYKK